MKLSNKKLQEKCMEDAQATANELNEGIVYQFFEDKFYTDSQYRKKLEKESGGVKLSDEDYEDAKNWDILTWYYPE